MTYRLQQLQKIVEYEYLLEEAKDRATQCMLDAVNIIDGKEWYLEREKINWAIAQRIDKRIQTLIKLL